ncbi:MAG TPA: Fe-S cluster assembly protein SufD [Anaerolineae bacterium]|nr:Fe-S cluster assembly protein SufD [Anaerolineae bacterium]HQK12511.1 Fe-S cluster assembly protein SufD [Anaerolineae bacterium]
MSAITVFAADPRAVDALSDFYAEPEWMRKARRDAWTLAQEMPFPHQKEEAWRRTPLHSYPLDALRVVLTPQGPIALDDLPPCWHRNMAPEDLVSGTLVHCNPANSYQMMRPEDVRSGVVFANLHQALHTHGDLIRRYWMQGRTTRPDFNKFTALHAAMWHGGTFVYVPAGVQVSRPLQTLVAYDPDAGSGLHHTLIIAEKGSRVSVIQDRVSQERRPELNVEMVEIYAEEGALVRYASFQHWGEKRYTVSVQEANLARDTNFLWVNGVFGGQMSKDFLTTSLNAPGARAQMHGFTFAMGDQRVDQSTYQHHRAPNTHSNLLYRNVLRDQAYTVFYGMIRAEPEAVGMEGYQANNNLLLSDAHAHSIPGLEIRCNDVRCSHGSTTSRIDPQQLFYLQARGLPERDAEGLIVQGFLRSAVERVPLAYMRDRLDEEILQRFWAYSEASAT